MGAAPLLDDPAGRGARLLAAPDERLVAWVRDGDRAAFETVYDRYHRQLLAFCRHMLGCREEAEDALQHVFMSAYRQLLGDDRAVQLRPWLYAIARNRCLSVLRARREAVALDDAPEPATEGLAVTSEVQHREDLRAMLRDLSRLPAEQRAALLLAELGDLAHDEIAAALNVQRDKVKSLVFQARGSLMAARQARDADCSDIQQQLATLQGSALRRATIRRHVEDCPACAAFQAEVRRQRAAIAAVLPVVPTFALKQNVLSSAFAAGPTTAVGASAAALSAVSAGGNVAAVSTAAAGIGAAAGASGLALKILVVVAVASGTAGGIAAVRDGAHRGIVEAPAALRSSSSELSETRARTDAALGSPALPTPVAEAGPQRRDLRSTDSAALPGVGPKPDGRGGATDSAPAEPAENRGPLPHSRAGAPGNSSGMRPEPAGSTTYAESEPAPADQGGTDNSSQSYPTSAAPPSPSGDQPPTASREPAGNAAAPPAAPGDAPASAGGLPTSSPAPAATAPAETPGPVQQSSPVAPVQAGPGTRP